MDEEKLMITSTETRERGWLLTGWLIFMFIANAYTLFTYATTIQDWLSHSDPRWDQFGWAFVVFAIGAALNVIATIALWRWKIWGLYLFAATSIIALILNIIVGVPIIAALLGLVGFVIVYVLVNQRRAYFS
jgi:hypothetical protein